jgi:hypothetical protein
MSDKRVIPLFYFKCCYHRVQEPIKIIVKGDKLILHFKCWYCSKEVILESKNGMEIETVNHPRDIKVFYLSEKGSKKKVREDICGQVFI